MLPAAHGVGLTLTFFSHAGHWALKAALGLGTLTCGTRVTPTTGPRLEVRMLVPRTDGAGLPLWGRGLTALRFTGNGLQLWHGRADLTGAALGQALARSSQLFVPSPVLVLGAPP